MRRLACVICLVGFLVPTHSSAQYDSPAERAAAMGGLPPFLAKMKRHDFGVRVLIPGDNGEWAKAPAGLPVVIRILAGGAKVRDYLELTGQDGTTLFKGIPSNPEVQGSITYQVSVEYEGVKFPFELDGVPADQTEVELKVQAVTTGIEAVVAEHNVEAFADEESLVVRHTVRLENTSSRVINLGALPGGGLMIPCPAGAKHPELHDEHDTRVEVRGTTLVYKGALLPAGSPPANIGFVYTIPYTSERFQWTQTLDVKTVGAMVVVPRHRQRSQREAIPLRLVTRGDTANVSQIDQGEGRIWEVLRTRPDRVIAAGQPFAFEVTGLPAASNTPFYLLALVLLGVFVFVLVPRKAQSTGQLSRDHLVGERDRLVKALARMRRAVERGKLSKHRFEREEEAITARLVSLYRAIDRIDGSVSEKP